ncbi:hypothetical protein GDO86_006916 [Hymenochirus boettgeri]|uniref:Protein YIPF n=1 Tax=Hymenochirus boettgeri TaxID=247094 RepID=A0A8T2JCZ1_9PIPI|nr:hypothetical protein GDO86_006916 [Hymenochirus boettgeri]
MASADDLKFQEFSEAADLLAANPGATTKSMFEEGQSQHATLHVGGDSEEEEEETDQTELLASQKKTSSFWTFQYYQDFFDIDTYQVLDRIRGAVLPIPGRNFVRHHLRNNPDLYGPFWICATLVITVTIMGNLGTFIQLHNQKEPHTKYSPQFHKLSVAAVAIYCYAWIVPLCLWGFLQWRKGVSPNVGSYSFIETVCVYGYSLFVYIPATVLCVVPNEPFRWVLILLAMILSICVLVLSVWQHIRRDNKMVVIGLIAIMVALHVLFAVGCKMYFFMEQENKTPVPEINATIQQTIYSTTHKV